jgi:hypothetical protein
MTQIKTSDFDGNGHAQSRGIRPPRSRQTATLQTVNELLQHVRAHHHESAVLYQCSSCRKTYAAKHNALCHVPKCRGPPELGVRGIDCTLCGSTFSTQRGLSQHERAAHPEARNANARLVRPRKNRQLKGTARAGPGTRSMNCCIWNYVFRDIPA